MSRLEDIGFYTLSDARAKRSTHKTRLERCELILTSECNFRCPYCRSMTPDLSGRLPKEEAVRTLRYWFNDGLRNVRFSGGEPTLYPWLLELVELCSENGVERIAISTNGSADIRLYRALVEEGVNDFSISLDGACCAVGDSMAGRPGSGIWLRVVENIRDLSRICYVTVGMVFTEDNVGQAIDAVLFAHNLGVADIRVIPSAQYNRALETLRELPVCVLEVHPILRYRVENIRLGRPVRGIPDGNCSQCRLALDDMAVAQGKHFPCIIYMREGGAAIGAVGPRMREERREWVEKHEPRFDPICSKNCLDVCVAYNGVAQRKKP